jgi:ATP-dependent RNA helicase SUPV3L1/SUV3
MLAGADDGRSVLKAVLGPTNTGKTHRAIERLLEHDSGMIGLPLRLLAREVYDRITRRIGEAPVALVTGEEKRIPPHPRYWVCTVEAMPTSREVDFLAVDEIQLAAHPERGHVFTDRLLHARGRRETWFLGADTMRGMIETLAPAASTQRYPRLSRLTATGAVSLSMLPPRTAVVAFSAERVYAIAERLRARRGGAALVLGALSPRARNAQVALYQSGEVDYMVATDAVGMGLNLDVDLVAFAELRKFDGQRVRELEPAELAQIAGRAGRHHRDGSFATLGPLPPLSNDVSRAIEMHTFAPEQKLMWRNSDLDKSSTAALIASLRRPPKLRCLRLADRSEDLHALTNLSQRPEIEKRARGSEAVSLLWDVCQVPDYRKLMLDEHTNLLADIFGQISGPTGRLDHDWIAERIAAIDDTEGDIDTLLMRLAFIRTWTYVTHHTAWLDGTRELQERTRNIEDRLSDALNEKLIQRFVDRSVRARVRPHAPRPQGRRGAAVEDAPPSGGPFSGLARLKLTLAKGASDAPRGLEEQAWIEDLVEAPHDRFSVDAGGRILDGARVIARMTKGVDLQRPEVALALGEETGAGLRLRVVRRLVAFTRDLVGELLAPLRRDEQRRLSPAARGLVYQLEQGLGTALFAGAREQIANLDGDDRTMLQRFGVHLGEHVVYLPALLKPNALAKRAALASAYWQTNGANLLPRPGAVSFPAARGQNAATCAALGYPLFGPRAVRADVAERVYVEAMTDRGERRTSPALLSSWMGCPVAQVAPILDAMRQPLGDTGT